MGLFVLRSGNNLSSVSFLDSAGFKYVKALGRIIIGGSYPPSNAIIYMHLQL